MKAKSTWSFATCLFHLRICNGNLSIIIHFSKLFLFFFTSVCNETSRLAKKCSLVLSGIASNGCWWWILLHVSTAWLLGPFRGLAWSCVHLPLLWSQRIQLPYHRPLQSSPVYDAFDWPWLYVETVPCEFSCSALSTAQRAFVFKDSASQDP